MRPYTWQRHKGVFVMLALSPGVVIGYQFLKAASIMSIVWMLGTAACWAGSEEKISVRHIFLASSQKWSVVPDGVEKYEQHFAT